MTRAFLSRMTRVPRAFDPERGQTAVESLAELPCEAAELIAGAAGSSDHFADLVRREGDWLTKVLSLPPEGVLTDLLSEDAPEDLKSLMPFLRRQKARLSLLVGLADLAGVWALDEVTGALTCFADRSTDLALKAGLRQEIARGKLPGQTEDDLASGAGLAILAMGKMGAGELNYSSDIDLICLFDETRFDARDYAEARMSFVRAIRAMTKILSDRTAEGYVFRTDLRLRPDASVTPVAISMEAAERYYESFGRTWERAAFIKARAAAGDLKAGSAFLEGLTPFIWRRHLDYAAIQDAQDMRVRIKDHKALHGKPNHLDHDLKLGQGGIRQIEFFTQTRQLIAGGRDADLRAARTVEALHALSRKGWVSPKDADTLTTDYRAHREAEHRVQMIADRQTHKLPGSEDEFARLAALSGRAPDAYAKELVERLERVHTLTDAFFAPDAAGTDRSTPEEVFPESETVQRWSGYPAMRSPRAVEIFERVWPKLRTRLAHAARPEEALAHFDGFLSGLPAGVQLFSLFEANPQLLDLVVDIVDTAPELGRYLSQNSGVFDAVLGGQFFSDWPGVDGLSDEIGAALRQATDYEAKLDTARLWSKEWHFRIGVHYLRGLIDAEQCGRQYADLAGAVLIALWPEVVAEFASKHGSPPGRGAAIVAMGSLGAERLNATSDLDLIVIYDGQGCEQSDGRRPLQTRTYYARLTQALVTAISAPTSKGRLYEVDMRLRPSGRQGPVATSLDAFKAYQTDEAWTWEHLALTRARPLAGDETLLQDIRVFRDGLISCPRDRAKVLTDTGEMLGRLHAAHTGSSPLSAKLGPGRLQDIELLAQAATLIAGQTSNRVSDQLVEVRRVFGLSDTDHQRLLDIAGMFWRMQTAAKLVEGKDVTLDIGAEAAAFLLRGSAATTLDELAARCAEDAEFVNGLVANVFGSAGGKE